MVLQQNHPGEDYLNEVVSHSVSCALLVAKGFMDKVLVPFITLTAQVFVSGYVTRQK